MTTRVCQNGLVGQSCWYEDSSLKQKVVSDASRQVSVAPAATTGRAHGRHGPSYTTCVAMDRHLGKGWVRVPELDQLSATEMLSLQ